MDAFGEVRMPAFDHQLSHRASGAQVVDEYGIAHRQHTVLGEEAAVSVDLQVIQELLTCAELFGSKSFGHMLRQVSAHQMKMMGDPFGIRREGDRSWVIGGGFIHDPPFGVHFQQMHPKRSWLFGGELGAGEQYGSDKAEE